MRSSFMTAEVRRFLDRTPKADVPMLVREFGIHHVEALDIYNEWARDAVFTLSPVTDPARAEELRVPLSPSVIMEAEARFIRGPLEGELADLQRDVVDWADRTFPDRTLNECFTKLMLDELPEVYKNPTSPEEYADLLVLVLDMVVLAIREHNARCDAIGVDDYLDQIDVVNAVREKMTVNKERQWATNPRTGLRQHIETPKGDKP